MYEMQADSGNFVFLCKVMPIRYLRPMEALLQKIAEYKQELASELHLQWMRELPPLKPA